MHYPKIEFSLSQDHKSDAVVHGFFHEKSEDKETPPLPRYYGKKSKEVDHLLGLLGRSRHFSAKKNEVSALRFYPFMGYPNVLLLGLGTLEQWQSELSRQAGASLFLSQKKERWSRVTVCADSFFSKVKKDDLAYHVQAFCEGYWLAGYRYEELKKEDKEDFVPQVLVWDGLPKNALLQSSQDQALILAKAINFARFLGDRPGNYLTPTEFGHLIEKMTGEHKLHVSIWRKREIEKEKMGLLLGVAKGSVEEPTFIILEHRGGKKADRPIALVGKGVTFDSGGISLKPAGRMEDMKYDMMGAAAVAGILQAAADLALPLNIKGFIAATENMPDGGAQKPGDVVKSLSGKTVEIINTDAEGRLILADALEYAQKFNPQAIFDFATLTGAVVDALGTTACGIMGNHGGLLDRMKDSGKHSGERVWELPLFEEFEEDLKSSVADIKNTGVREAGSSKGGTFLKFFVHKKYPWAHCDIAGAAYHRKDVNYHPSKYGAGVMIRLMADLLSHWKPLK